MKGLVWGGAGAGSLETTEPKSVTVGIRQRGRWDVVGFGRDKEKLEIQVIKDTMVDGGEVLDLKLGGLCSEPLEKCDLVVMEIGVLEDVKVPLTLLCVSWRVVDVAGNGGLT